MDKLKISGLSLILVLLSNVVLIFSRQLASEIILPSSQSIYIFVIFLLSIALFLTLFGIILLVSESKVFIAILYLALIATFMTNELLSSGFEISFVGIVNLILIILSLLLIETKFRQEIRNQVTTKPSVISTSSGILILFIALSISYNYYNLNSELSPEKSNYEKVKSYLSDTTNIYIEKTIGTEFIKENLPQVSVYNVYDPEMATQIIANQESDLENMAKDHVSDRIDEILDPYKQYFIPFSTALIFISIISLAPIVRILTILFSFLVFKLLILLKIVNEETEMIEVVRYRI